MLEVKSITGYSVLTFLNFYNLQKNDNAPCVQNIYFYALQTLAFNIEKIHTTIFLRACVM